MLHGKQYLLVPSFLLIWLQVYMSNKTQSLILTNEWLILLRLDTMLLQILEFTVNRQYYLQWQVITWDIKKNTTRFYQTHRVHKLNFSMASWFAVRNHHSIIDSVETAAEKQQTFYTHLLPPTGKHSERTKSKVASWHKRRGMCATRKEKKNYVVSASIPTGTTSSMHAAQYDRSTLLNALKQLLSWKALVHSLTHWQCGRSVSWENEDKGQRVKKKREECSDPE